MAQQFKDRVNILIKERGVKIISVALDTFVLSPSLRFFPGSCMDLATLQARIATLAAQAFRLAPQPTMFTMIT